MGEPAKELTGLGFDEKLASSYVGKYILVGITYLDHTGVELRRQQLHGIIKSASREGILLSLKGVCDGKSWNMPPMLDSIRVAKLGTYTLHMTQETIENPDLLASWTVQDPPPNGKTSSNNVLQRFVHSIAKYFTASGPDG